MERGGGIYMLLPYLVLAAQAAIGVIALLLLRERHEKPAYVLAAAGGAGILLWILGFVMPTYTIGPVVRAASVGAIGAGILLLFEERFPKKHTLPGAIAKYGASRVGDFGIEILIGFFALAFMLLSFAGEGGPFGPTRAATCFGILVLLGGSVVWRMRAKYLHWVLERTPEWVVWIYVQRVRVVNRGYSMWSVCVGLKTGTLITQGCESEQAAQDCAREVQNLCPQARVGYDAQIASQFAHDPMLLIKK
jgi:hypothetical protein